MTTIGIAEDEPSIADTLTYTLKTEGYETLHWTTGSEAVAAVKEQNIALLILDIGLPDISGFEVARQIRTFSSVPILFLTARSHEVDRIVGLEIGGDDYVTKPFSPRELGARVRAILRRAADPRGASRENKEITLPTGTPFEVDEVRVQISYFGTPLHLTRYEYRLLAVLISQPGRVFTRENLMNLVWDDPAMSMDRTVDAHIKSLRQKLRTVNESCDPLITHRGLGYSLRETW